jgi:hypothetical protein
MQVRMQNVERLTEQQIGEFLRGSEVIEFGGQSRAEVYAMVQESLVRQEYFRQGKRQRGAIRAYLSKLAGLSLPQMTRLIRQHRAAGVRNALHRNRCGRAGGGVRSLGSLLYWKRFRISGSFDDWKMLHPFQPTCLTPPVSWWLNIQWSA